MQKKTAGILSAATAGGLLVAGMVTTTSHSTHHAPVRVARVADATTTATVVSLDNCPTLVEGNQGNCVSQLQTDLNGLDNAGLSTDGIFGSSTYQAVITFQRDSGLTQLDGSVGSETKQAIDNSLDAAPPVAPATTAPPATSSSPSWSDVVNCGDFTCTTYFSRSMTKAMDAAAQSKLNASIGVDAAAAAGICGLAALPLGGGVASVAVGTACALLAAEDTGSYYDQLNNAALAGQCFAIRTAGDPESPQYGLYGEHYLVRSDSYCHD
jgi:hypothetical protein